MTPRFTVIVPAYNAADTVEASALSALNQNPLKRGDVEVIIVDDGSTDATAENIVALAANHPGLRAAATPANAGPGAARNVGIALARGDWILFLDSDDRLAQGALDRLASYLDSFNAGDTPQAVGIDWCFTPPSGMPLPTAKRRRDQEFLIGNRTDRLRRYLCLQMDGSVIYTAIRRDLMLKYNLRFANGYHEDVDFMFKVYYLAERIAYLDQVLYLKTDCSGSIVNSISVRHIEGFLRAWEEIAGFLAAAAPEEWIALRHDWQRGLTSVVATRLREIARRSTAPNTAAQLYRTLYQRLAQLPAPPNWAGARPTSQYEQIADRFFTLFGEPGQDEVAAEQLTDFVRDTANKTWSCIDLHHSAFLAPDQIRTCCKRFFVDGEMRGDVVLINSADRAVTAETILFAKRDLHTRINRGDATPCDGCPFMEFKNWGTIERLDIHYLSMEYQSICNLKCTYCSETYYGGSSPHYDVVNLIDELLANHTLTACHTVVWGGGEPVVDKNFIPLIEKLVERLPKAGQRVLTNAVKHSKTVERLVADGKAMVTTSIDAGTAGTFALVRGKAKLQNVLATLRRYAAAAPEQVTVKYIFTAQNHYLDEIRAFVGLVEGSNLAACNFQISSDFNEETVSPTVALAMIALYGLLHRAGVQVIFFDDLLRHRLSDTLAGHDTPLRNRLTDLGLADILADPADYPTIVVWGAGWQSRYLLENTAFFKRVPVAFFVDQTAAKIGSTYFDRPVKSPESLKSTAEPVVIAATQNFPVIYRNFLALGLPPERLVRQLIL
jgi:glycosyltransferase involved in cell wall biosynthesis